MKIILNRNNERVKRKMRKERKKKDIQTEKRNE